MVVGEVCAHHVQNRDRAVVTYEEIEVAAKALFYAEGGIERDWVALDQAMRNHYLHLAKATTEDKT